MVIDGDLIGNDSNNTNACVRTCPCVLAVSGRSNLQTTRPTCRLYMNESVHSVRQSCVFVVN